MIIKGGSKLTSKEVQERKQKKNLNFKSFLLFSSFSQRFLWFSFLLEYYVCKSVRLSSK